MSGFSARASLAPEIFRQVDKVCQRFEAAWKAGHRPPISPYLSDIEEPIRSALLGELILLDWEYRARRGEQPAAADYYRQFPRDIAAVEAAVRQSADSANAGRLTVELRVVAGPHQGRSFSFDGHDRFIVGRASWAHFRLPRADPYFSRVHFLIEVNPPCCRLFDMGSTNGTRVNGRRVETADLEDGDLIQGGDTVLKVTLSAASAAQAPPEPRPELQDAAPASTLLFSPGPPSLSPAVPANGQAAAQPPSRLPDISGYRIERELGRGGMGVVYLATRLGDGSPVAIKTIWPRVSGCDDDRQRFLREFSILQQLHHPHIVRFHESGQAGRLLYFVMDYVAGMSAASLLENVGPLAPGRAVHLVCQALDALDYAHRQGFVHRDVKPGNLLIEQGPEGEICKVADFGLARAYDASRLSGLTMMGDVAGTLPFMPPEQITSFRDARPAADQYSAAATLYYLLTCHPVYNFREGPSHQRILQVLNDDPVPLRERRPDIPQALADAIHRALQKDPRQRFASAAEFRAAIVPFSVPSC